MNNRLLLLGIDGGATKVSGWIINKDGETDSFGLTSSNMQKKYSEYEYYNPSFKPVGIKIQLDEMNSSIKLTDEEKIQGLAYMHAASDVIVELSKNHKGKKLLIGFGMPGLKTPDKRGIVALANGPRMPEFVSWIENKLKENKIDFYPIKHLGSDADYCGIGEEYDKDGMFKDVENAYYLGGGTGVADAMKLKGELLVFDAIKPWIAKTWEMKSKSGLSLERYASAGGIQFLYSENSKISVAELNEKEFYPPSILSAAINGDSAALKTINSVSEEIANLLYERISTIYFGALGAFDFVNANKPALDSNHQFKGILLDRIVIGQRLGDLFEESKKSNLLWNDIMNKLGKIISDCKAENFKKHYLIQNKFNSDLIKISKLREAPAIGAGVDAFLNLK